MLGATPATKKPKMNHGSFYLEKWVKNQLITGERDKLKLTKKY